jgi:hypothetical protein
VIQIAPSNGVTILGNPPRGQKPKSTFADADGDQVTISLGGKTGSLTYYLTNGKGPISEIDLAGTDPLKSTVSITVKKPKHGKGDGRIQIDEVDGAGFKSFTARTGDLVGAGFNLTGFAGSIRVGNVSNGAAFNLPGAAPAARPKSSVRITAGTIGDGTAITVAAPLKSLTVTSFGAGSVTAPSIGTMTVSGNLAADVTATGARVAANKAALGSLRVKGSIVGSNIDVNGNVTSVSARQFVDSRLFAGYSGPADGSGTFSTSAAIQSFRVTGATDAFANSTVIASILTSVVLQSAQGDNNHSPFGFIADDAIIHLKVISAAFVYDNSLPQTQGFEDFEVRVLGGH